MSQQTEADGDAPQPRKLVDFLTSAGVGISERVIDATGFKPIDPSIVRMPGVVPRELEFRWPRLLMYCPNCDGERYFGAMPGQWKIVKNQDLFVLYLCKNCTLTIKTYALRVGLDDVSAPNTANFIKIGEFPSLDEKVPNRLLVLVGKDRQMFLQGRRAERAGLGIGAFGYYRRVVENQKSEILAAVAEAAKALGHDDFAAEVMAANQERQFAAAIDKIKRVLPESLRVGGHDPLRVLHSALSEGLHNKDDQHCLEYAGTIREVLGGLAERIAHAKQDEAKLRSSIGKLLKQADGQAE
ncbi:hypothetical protein SAMN05428982_1930 [Pseudoxanthomonas sp. CF385]|uniref:hypothetical protein n=1 Tax=Pseudoxanthomonas sp. CF385 TaxID=1881042 RepID=UPI00088BA104|nr:hypothetical protein [Pseudoxanthomonas sp. CF385]SDQ64159.1 hypothetical protein SAMN05428982_1930 [Pseudoxanthomonas sp. CF385]